MSPCESVLALLLLASAGCLTEAPAATPRPTETNALEHAPRWQAGEWWRLRVSDVFSGESKDVMRVVASTAGDTYLVGMPADGFHDDLLPLHIPGFGDVATSNLSFQVHNQPFTLIEFPVVDGDGWTTHFEGGLVTTTMHVIGANEVMVHIGGSWPGVALYDARIGEFTHLEIRGYATIDVLDHGFGYTGTVLSPSHETLVYGGWRSLVASSRNPTPSDTFAVSDPDFTGASFVALAGNAVNASTSASRIDVTTPDGVVHTYAPPPLSSPGYHQAAFQTDAPTGPWEIRYLVAGSGYALAEVIAYHAVTTVLGPAS